MARASGGGSWHTVGTVLRHFRRRDLDAKHGAYRAADGVGYPADTPPERPDSSVTSAERGLPPAGSQRRWRRCASLSVRCQRPPQPASRRSGGNVQSPTWGPSAWAGQWPSGCPPVMRGDASPGARGSIAPSVSSTVLLFCISWRGCPVRRWIIMIALLSVPLDRESARESA